LYRKGGKDSLLAPHSPIKGGEVGERFSSQFADPVVIVSVATDKKRNIMTAAWVSPVSFEPPIVMVSVSPRRYTHGLLLEAKEFTLSILTDQQRQLSTAAGVSTGRKKDKLKLEIFKTEEGKKVKAPFIKDSRAVLECKLIKQLTIGDHTIFLGEVVHFTCDRSKSPLILFNRKYYSLGEYIADYP